MAATALSSPVLPPQPDDQVVERLRQVLVAERAAQSALGAEHRSTSEALTGQRDVDSILEREIADASAVRAHDAVEAIDGALAAIAAGSYGVCESCGTSIPVERLEAVPHARFCVACASRNASAAR
jgi:RNA polymerase-binding transcription factor DksA